MLKYGDKRNYRKIDILTMQGGILKYKATTTWANNLKIAKERYSLAYNIPEYDIKTVYQKE